MSPWQGALHEKNPETNEKRSLLNALAAIFPVLSSASSFIIFVSPSGPPPPHTPERKHIFWEGGIVSFCLFVGFF